MSTFGSDTKNRSSPHTLELQKLTFFLRIPQRETLAFHQFCTAAGDKSSDNSKQVALLHLSSPQISSASWATVDSNTRDAMYEGHANASTEFQGCVRGMHPQSDRPFATLTEADPPLPVVP